MNTSTNFNVFTLNSFAMFVNFLPTTKIDKSVKFLANTARFIWLLIELFYIALTSKPAKRFYNFVGYKVYQLINVVTTLVLLLASQVIECYKEAYKPEVKPTVIGRLSPAPIPLKAGDTWQEFVVKNLADITNNSNPELEKLQPEIEPKPITIELKLENPVVVDLDGNVSVNQVLQYEAYSSDFVRFWAIWSSFSQLAQLYKAIKASELKEYAKELEISNYRKLKKLELLVAISNR